MPDLKSLRSQLDQINQDIFNCFKKRSDLVSKIQQQKIKDSAWSAAYDAGREVELFKTWKKQKVLTSLEELLSFSLIMERHAQFDENFSYPRWSRLEHIEKSQGELCERVNPLMLLVFFPEVFQGLSLKENYMKVFQPFLKV